MHLLHKTQRWRSIIDQGVADSKPLVELFYFPEKDILSSAEYWFNHENSQNDRKMLTVT